MSEYRLIPLHGKLGEGKFAIVDSSDFDLYAQFRWVAICSKATGDLYAVRYKKVEGKNTAIMLHRLIAKCPADRIVDHENGNTLDDRSSNLRVCLHGQNMQNRKPSSVSRSKFKGVYLDKRSGNWRAEIVSEGIRYRLGSFKKEIDAAKAYNAAAEKLHKSFARLNPI